MLYPAMLPIILAIAAAPFVGRVYRQRFYKWALVVIGVVAIIGCILKNVGLLPA
jgi:uncharacterized membrane protein YhaH (DUF805 family)